MTQFNPQDPRHLRRIEKCLDIEFTPPERLRFLTKNYYNVTDIIHDNRLSLIYHIKLILQGEENQFCFNDTYRLISDIITENTDFKVYPLKGVYI